jgi:hypothetical protein
MTKPTACVANIGPRGRKQRLQIGMIWLAIGSAAAGVLALVGVPRWLRLGLFGPFAFGAMGVFQAYEQTCLALAARGTRDLDSGQEQVDDPAATRQINRQARKVFAESILGAALLTALALALPRRRWYVPAQIFLWFRRMTEDGRRYLNRRPSTAVRP